MSDITKAILPADWYEITETGLRILRTPKMGEYLELGEKLNILEGSLFYIWGDYLNEGEKTYGEMYAQALDVSGYKFQSLANAASVCRKIPREIKDPETGEITPLRRPARDVSPSVHKAIARFSKGPDDHKGHKKIDEWLTFAETFALGERKMRKVIKVLPSPDIPDAKDLSDKQINTLIEVGLLDPQLQPPLEAVPEAPQSIKTEDHDLDDLSAGVVDSLSELAQKIGEGNDPVKTYEELIERIGSERSQRIDVEQELDDHRWKITDILACRRALWARAWRRERGRRREADRRISALEEEIKDLKQYIEAMDQDEVPPIF